MADEIAGIPLADIISSLASAVVATNQHLDQASVDLRNLYLSSGNAGLANLIPSRFTLDEVTIELAFVVTDTKPQVEIQLPEIPRPPGFSEDSITLTANQTNTLDLFLIQATKDDAVAGLENTAKVLGAQLTGMEASLNNVMDSIEKFKKAKNPLQTQVNALTSQINTISVAIAKQESDIARLKNELNSSAFSSVIKRPVIMAQINTISVQIRTNEAKRESLKAQINALTATTNALNAQIAALTQQAQGIQKSKLSLQQAVDENNLFIKTINNIPKNDSLSADQFSTLSQRKIKLIDYLAVWSNLFAEYIELCKAWDKALASYEKNQNLAKIPDYSIDNNELATVGRIQKISDSKIKDKVNNVKADYEATVKALNDLVRQMIAKKNSGVKVRIDEEGLKNVPPESRQKMKLNFHGQSQENIKVDGRDIEIPK